MTGWTWGAIGLALGSTVLVYAGYPLWLAWRTRGIDGAVPARWSRRPTVCIVVAAHDEEACIAARLHNLQGLRYPPELLTFLVVADGCSDRTEDIVAGFSDGRVRLVSRRARQGKVNALNAAVALSEAEIIVGTDANCWFEPDCLEYLLAPFAESEVSCVAGAKRIWSAGGGVGTGEGWYWRYESWLKERDAVIGSALGVTGEVFAIRRACWEDLPPDTILEDFVLAIGQLVAGRRVAYAPQAVAWETPSASWTAEFERKTRIVAGAWQALRSMKPLLWPPRGILTVQLVGHRLLRWMVVPWCWAIALTSLFLEAILHPDWPVTLLLGLLIGGVLLGIRRPRGLAHALAYFLLTQAAACAGAIRFWRGRQSVTWRRVPRTPMPS
ncbi:MAG: glycosyltransferase [bacterium]|nr:glycosyltransferase [bacterium]